MHIINAMFGRKLGGIEQSFLDYAKALKSKNHRVTALIDPKAQIRPMIEAEHIDYELISNLGSWDPTPKLKIRSLIKRLSPDAMIAHGNRALQLLSAAKQHAPLVLVTHNYKLKYARKADYFFTITEDLKRRVLNKGIAEEKISVIPNMIDLRQITPHSQTHDPLVIGAMGRFVHKKGFAVFLDAIAKLKAKSAQEFRVILAGEGEERAHLEKKCQDLGLTGIVSMPGWISKKHDFFNAIDLFCLPSLHEPFGIILLEAFAYEKPVVTSLSEGPQEIVTDKKNALVAPVGDSNALAAQLLRALEDKKLRQKLVKAGQETVTRYDIQTVVEKIEGSLHKFVVDDSTRGRS